MRKAFQSSRGDILPRKRDMSGFRGFRFQLSILNPKWASPYPLSARVRTDSLRAAILSREAVKRLLRFIRKRLHNVGEGFLLYDQCQSSNEPSGRKRRTMRGIFPLRSSF